MLRSLKCVVVALMLLGQLSATWLPQASAGPQDKHVDQYGDLLPAESIARLGTGRLYQPGVYFLAFSPDETKLAAADSGERLCVWDVGTGKLVHQWKIPKF